MNIVIHSGKVSECAKSIGLLEILNLGMKQRGTTRFSTGSITHEGFTPVLDVDEFSLTKRYMAR